MEPRLRSGGFSAVPVRDSHRGGRRVQEDHPRHPGQRPLLVSQRVQVIRPGNRAPLSFPIPGWNICVDFPIKAGLNEFVSELDRRVLEFGGRLYTAKDSRTTAETFHAMYPRIDEWIAVRRKVDPLRVFASDMARRLELL
ncbi:D-arabinono-1,4-lactone oxidase family protein [Mycobacterium kansasii]|uniref:D-arabinono-1,4-lactone oxidase family protein n=1 Tax=Mycobacterium kansasii TaxID=1768 RepID=A0A1V3XAW3_MYCKA|nr:D-arabinono-1,4-lactone oxidase family protein [Mycobacterium kansasii]